MNQESVLKQINDVLATRDQNRIKACIERLTQPGDPYRKILENGRFSTINGVFQYDTLLTSMRDDIKAGYVGSFSDPIRIEVETDYIDMAKRLLDDSASDAAVAAAAVLCGCTIERRLRDLAEANGIDLTKPNGTAVPASALLVELRRKDVVSVPRERIIQAHLDVRNSAAHGRQEYNRAAVEEMHRFALTFLDETQL